MNAMRPIHPGEVLKEELAAIGMTANAFAQALHVPANRITAILNGTRSITADTALRISLFFGTTPEFWLNLQTAYDLKIARESVGEKLKREVKSFMPAITHLKHAICRADFSRSRILNIAHINNDSNVKSLRLLFFVIPAKAGTQSFQLAPDSRFHGRDGILDFLRDHQ